VDEGGRVRTKTINAKQYIHVCYDKEGKSHSGEVKTKQSEGTMNLIEKIDNLLENQLIFNGYHLKDDILAGITLEELQTVLYSNIPKEKLDERTAMKELETLIAGNVKDAKYVAKKVISEIIKDLKNKI
jgi:hypothetical protein